MATLAPNKFDWSDLPFWLFTVLIILSFIGLILYIIYNAIFS